MKTNMTLPQEPKPAAPKAVPGVQKRLKLFVWAEAGAGKTVTNLQFPKVAAADLAGGVDPNSRRQP